LALATQTDVEQRIQVLFANPTEPVITALIEAAQSQYERQAGRPLESAAYAETYDPPPGAALFLRHPPVTAIGEVAEEGVVLVVADDYYFTTSGRLVRMSDGYPVLWTPRKRQTITVEYTGGYETTHFLWDSIEDDVAWMVAAAFQRGAAAASDSGSLEGVESEQIGTHILRYMSSLGDPTQWISMTEGQQANARGLRIWAVG
jgi:hypothetical protein